MIILRPFFRHHFEKNLHGVHVAFFKNEEKFLAGQWFRRAITLPVLPHVLALHNGPHTLGSPALFRLADAAEARFVLNPKANLACQPQIFDNFRSHFYSEINFFEASMVASSALFGCCERGMTFRHP